MKPRINLKLILNNPKTRRELLVEAGLFIQHLEGIQTSRQQMTEAYDKVQREKYHV